MGESNRSPSEKVKFLSCIAMIAVVAGHSAPRTAMGMAVDRVFLFAVPWFFFVSGFYFIKSVESRGILELVKRKIKTLLLPYVIWCLLGWVIFRPSLPMLCCEIFGLAHSYPIGNLPLWYVMALMIFMIIGCLLQAI